MPLLGLLQTGFADMTDHRSSKPDISLTDALMSAFALFSLKSPSLLAFDKERTEGNVQRVYGIERVPCDTRMRERLDPVEPESLRPLFKHVFGALQRGKALEEMVFVEGHYLLSPQWHRLFFLPTDSLCVVFRIASPQRHRHLSPPDGGRCPYSPRPA